MNFSTLYIIIVKMQYSHLGKYIKYLRIQQNISLNKFALNCDVDSAILSRIENLQQNIKLNVLVKITKGFGLTPAEFLTNFEKFKGKL